MSSLWFRLHFWSWTSLVLLLGYLLGTFLLAVEEARSPTPLTVLPSDVHRPIPTIRMVGIQNGSIVGTVGTGARLVIGGRSVLPGADGTFSLDAAPFLVNIVDIAIPSGAAFVASIRGKNYYPVSSSAAARLKPENRVYFRDASEAEKAGYKRGK